MTTTQDNSNQQRTVVTLGSTGAVGSACLQELLTMPQVQRLTLLGRRAIANLPEHKVEQLNINIFDAGSYAKFLKGHDTAICTLGVGQPSKVSREEFLKIDKQAVLDFAGACKAAGVQHFELLSSISIDANSSTFYLRAKGELVEELKALNFTRLSIFQPSMILTPVNRYGIGQAIVLGLWPLLKPLLMGGLRKYRGVKVERLGKAMAINILGEVTGMESLTWDDFQTLCDKTAG